MWGALIAVEVVLGVAIAAGSVAALRAGAILFAAACAVQVAAIMLGRGGRPCACLGARGTLGSASTGRAALLATALALAPLLPRTTPTTDQWLAIGLVGALIGLVVLTVVVLRARA